MKMTLEITLDVDPDAWARFTGVPPHTEFAVRSDVADHIEYLVSHNLRSGGVINSMSTVIA
jgi:hypothetical protein